MFRNVPDNGLFTPFNSTTSSAVRYGDGGWIGTGASLPETLRHITLGLATVSGTVAGKTDIVFTFNDGDPSGLVFGSGNPLYTTTIVDVDLPVTPGGPTFFDLEIPLPDVVTLGGFNNIGFSVGVQNFAFDGNFGFQASTANGQQVGFYTNNASFFDGTNWSLFSFGADPNTGVANFVATVYVPEPGMAGLLVVASAALMRRRR